MSCVYGCKTDGRPCPRPHTCHTIGPKLAAQRAIDEQAKTDRQAANGHADDTEELDSDIGEIILDRFAIALIVWLVAFVFAPALAGYLSHMK